MLPYPQLLLRYKVVARFELPQTLKEVICKGALNLESIIVYC